MISNELLKNKIYQLAFSGRLVNNEPNSIKISVDDVEGDYELPSNWKWFRVTDLFDFVGGSQPPKSEFSDELKDGYVRLYQTRDYGEKPIPVFVKKDSVSKFTNDGDILLARYGGSLGKVFRAKQGAYNVAMAKVVFKYECMNVDYVYDFFLSPLYQNFVKTLSKMAQAGFNQNDLRKLLIPVPPIEEQKKIVEKINKLFDLLDKKEVNDQEKEKLKEILKSKILRNAFCGELIDNNDSLESIDNEEFKGDVPFKIPSNWKWCEYKSIGDSGIGLTYRPENVSDDGIIVLRSSNIQNGKLDLKDIVRVNCKVNENIIVKENDILICARNGSKRLVGKSCLLVDMKERMTYGAFMTIFRTPYFKYVYWFMQSRYYYNQLYENTNTMTINQVTQKKLNSLVIPLPPLEEQKRIVEKIESLFELIEQL